MIEDFSAIDQKLFLVINSWHVTWLNPVMVFLSGQFIWLPLIVLILFFSYKQLERRSFWIFVLFLTLALIASDVTSSYLLKNIVQRLRPCRVAEIKALMNHFGQKCGGRFGFVSSHAANSFCVLVFTFAILKFKSLKMHWLWLVPGVVSLSRVYLGVHYPGDILGGMVVGASWGLLLATFFKKRESWSQSP